MTDKVVLDEPGTAFHGLTLEKARIVNNAFCGLRVSVVGGATMVGIWTRRLEPWMFYRMILPGELGDPALQGAFDLELLRYDPVTNCASPGTKWCVSAHLIERMVVVSPYEMSPCWRCGCWYEHPALVTAQKCTTSLPMSLDRGSNVGDAGMSDGMDTGAIFSYDRTYRYMLWRQWDSELPKCTFIGLNPSTADEIEDDPTIRRCIRFARDWGYGRMQMLNIFAYRATDPLVMRLAEDPVGPVNDEWITEAVSRSAMTVAAWGNHGVYRERQRDVKYLLLRKGLLHRVHCLGTTKSGCPRHPLRLRASMKPEVWV